MKAEYIVRHDTRHSYVVCWAVVRIVPEWGIETVKREHVVAYHRTREAAYEHLDRLEGKEARLAY